MTRCLLWLALAGALFAAPQAFAQVAFEQLEIADSQGPPIEAGVWYPRAASGRAPLVVVSHGTGGSFRDHEDTALALAEAGFVVAALTHTGDNWRDHSRAAQVRDRPRQFGLLIEHMLSAWPGRERIDPARIGAFGFSAGGFTALVAAGGEPDMTRIKAHCAAHPDYFDCNLGARTGPPPPADFAWAHDRRIKAVVVAAPALGFTFDGAGLADVRQPVQLWRAEDDQILPHPDYAEAVRLALPQPADYHVVPHAGHLDFLSPCSPERARRAPQICVSAPGFDRAAFHTRFNREVAAFFRRTFRRTGRPRADDGDFERLAPFRVRGRLQSC